MLEFYIVLFVASFLFVYWKVVRPWPDQPVRLLRLCFMWVNCECLQITCNIFTPHKWFWTLHKALQFYWQVLWIDLGLHLHTKGHVILILVFLWVFQDAKAELRFQKVSNNSTWERLLDLEYKTTREENVFLVTSLSINFTKACVFLMTRRVVFPTIIFQQIPWSTNILEVQTYTAYSTAKSIDISIAALLKCVIGTHDFDLCSLLFGKLPIGVMWMIMRLTKYCKFVCTRW